jgi:hypothetical protein
MRANRIALGARLADQAGTSRAVCHDVHVLWVDGNDV